MIISMKFKEQLKRLNHHAYCLIGANDLIVGIVSILESRHDIPAKGNPDLFVKEYETFVIDDARELKSRHEMIPVDASGKKIFIVAMNGITIEAQNALLKLLEEPAEYAHFFLIIPSAHLLLPTVKSRLFMIDQGLDDGKRNKTEDDMNKDIEILLKSGVAKRLEFAKKLTDDISKEKKTKKDAIDLLNGIEKLIYEKKGVKQGKKSLETVALAKKYLDDRAPSVKMLLDYVMINL